MLQKSDSKTSQLWETAVAEVVAVVRVQAIHEGASLLMRKVLVLESLQERIPSGYGEIA